ncbi:MAG: hypothetical protein JXB88_18215 [Spirochaetales bacterium]|nr:hypothetical protein [Spirochaetales bacterium]
MRFQELDYIALSLLGAGYAGLGYPACINGNNFSYRKSLFYQVGGFSGIEHIKSSDDDLLLDKFVTQSDKKIVYCRNKDAIVETAPAHTTRELLNQRARWASKVFNYKRLSYTILLVGVFLFNLFLCFFPLIALLLPQAHWFILGVLFCKIVVEGSFILPRLKGLNRLALLYSFFILELFHARFIVYIGFAGISGNFQWKPAVKKAIIKTKEVKETSSL